MCVVSHTSKHITGELLEHVFGSVGTFMVYNILRGLILYIHYQPFAVILPYMYRLPVPAAPRPKA